METELSVLLVIDKTVKTAAEAVAGLHDGATLLISGFGESGVPSGLIEAVLVHGAKDLTIVANNAGSGDGGIAALLREDRVRKVVCSYPRSRGSVWFERRFEEGSVELELVPQGTLTERIRAAGAGIAGFYTRTGAGTALTVGKEHRTLGGEECVLELPLRGDLALIRALKADRWGNLVYSKAARNYGPTMATAATMSVVEVDIVVGLGEIDPEAVVTPGIYIDRVWPRNPMSSR